jgi:cytidyltransferase-like protein
MTGRVLADGVFDPVHPGHLAYLRAAQALGDDLVVQVSHQRKRSALFPQSARAQLLRHLGDALGFRVVEHATTAQALRVERPAVYCKGPDWTYRDLPAEERDLCAQLDIRFEVVYPDEVDSSTRLLTQWAAQVARQGAAELDADAHVQRVVPFDANAQGYADYGARVAIEARHPEILAQLCAGKTILDVGCGPGHLVQMLRERGVTAVGFDPYLSPRYAHCYRADIADAGDNEYDVVVCREVLEHVPVREWGDLLHHLFRVAKARVYLTTRFYLDPPHPFALTNEYEADPSHITVLPQPFVRALCATFGGTRDRVWESALDWQHKDRVLVYQVTR